MLDQLQILQEENHNIKTHLNIVILVINLMDYIQLYLIMMVGIIG